MIILLPSLAILAVSCMKATKSKWWIALKVKIQSMELSTSGICSAADSIVLKFTNPAALNMLETCSSIDSLTSIPRQMVKAQVLQELEAVSSCTATDIGGGNITVAIHHILYEYNWL